MKWSRIRLGEKNSWRRAFVCFVCTALAFSSLQCQSGAVKFSMFLYVLRVRSEDEKDKMEFVHEYASEVVEKNSVLHCVTKWEERL